MTTSSLSAALLRSARGIAGQLTILIKQNAPRHLQDNIKTTVVEEAEGVIRITPSVIAPDARAQEYGSGLQDRKRPHEIKIFPVKGKMLAFLGTHGYGNEFSQYDPTTRQGVGDKNIVLTKAVLHHPGIHAVNGGKGYVRPALKEFRKYIKEGSFPDEIRGAIVSDIRRAFRGND